MTSSPLPDTVDTATYPPSTRVEVTIDCIVDQDGKLEPLQHFNTRTGLSYLYGPIDGEMDVDAAVEMYGARVARIEYAEAPAPYSEPREGDEVEVTPRAIRGEVRFIGAPRPWVHALRGAPEDVCVVGTNDFAEALAEGRVRLVEAAAPTFEPGRIYRSESTGEPFLYSQPGPNVWFKVDDEPGWFTADEVPADLVPCDVVPSEATP